MSNANKAMIRAAEKQLNGKQRYKENSKKMSFKISVEQKNAEFERMLLAKSYNTVLL